MPVIRTSPEVAVTFDALIATLPVPVPLPLKINVAEFNKTEVAVAFTTKLELILNTPPCTSKFAVLKSIRPELAVNDCEEEFIFTFDEVTKALPEK